MRKLLSLMALFVISLLAVSQVSASGISLIQWGTVKVNGDVLRDGSVLSVQEGEKLSIRVGLEAGSAPNVTVEDVEVEARISGYEYADHDSLTDSTPLFDIAAGTTKYVDLEVSLPVKLDKDVYSLRLRVLDKNSDALTKTIQLNVEPTRHGVDIADVTFSPGSTVKAGRSLLTTVLLENFGDKDERDVKVAVSIPELGVSATEFVDVLKTDNHNVDYEDVPEMFLPIPATAEEGDYQVIVTVSYEDLRETVTKTSTIKVLADARFQPTADARLVLAVGPEIQPIVMGKTGTYGLALTNAGAVSKAYVFEVQNGGWATIALSESVVVLEPGKNKVIYAEVTPNAGATLGEHVASLVVKSGGEALETVALKAVVTQEALAPQQTTSLRGGIEIALVVLVVLLVIVGLVVGFSRLRKDNGEEGKEYY